MATILPRVPQGTILKVSGKSGCTGVSSRDFLKKSRKLAKIKNYKSALEFNPTMHTWYKPHGGSASDLHNRNI